MSLKLADILRRHWPDYVVRAGGPHKIPREHWRAVEAVLACRTERMGGHLYRCPDCNQLHHAYHSCNHRACPQCGSHDQHVWAAQQQARLLPVPYYMITFTVPKQLRAWFIRYDAIAYKLLFDAVAAAIKELFSNEKYFGGHCGFVAILHTWTRQMDYHPHLHVMIPAIAIAPDGCEVIHPKEPEFLLPHAAVAAYYQKHFFKILATDHKEAFEAIDRQTLPQTWNVNIQSVGKGKSALRYLAAYVNKSAFSEQRLLNYDAKGNLLLSWKDSSDGRTKVMTLQPGEFIRRWLLHILPRGFMRIRHYGFLGGAARKSFFRVRFLLGCGRIVLDLPKLEPLCCRHCQQPLELLRKLQPVRGPPLSTALLSNP